MKPTHCAKNMLLVAKYGSFARANNSVVRGTAVACFKDWYVALIRINFNIPYPLYRHTFLAKDVVPALLNPCGFCAEINSNSYKNHSCLRLPNAGYQPILYTNRQQTSLFQVSLLDKPSVKLKVFNLPSTLEGKSAHDHRRVCVSSYLNPSENRPTPNTLRITATDHLGNARSQELQVNRIAVGSDRLTLLSGNRQTAPANTQLAKPLSIVALSAAGEPLANLPISFDILRGTGKHVTHGCLARCQCVDCVD